MLESYLSVLTSIISNRDESITRQLQSLNFLQFLVKQFDLSFEQANNIFYNERTYLLQMLPIIRKKYPSIYYQFNCFKSIVSYHIFYGVLHKIRRIDIEVVIINQSVNKINHIIF